METVLSKRTLGVPLVVGTLKNSYTRNGFTVKRMKKPLLDKIRYIEVVVKPTLGWYPSKTANFRFGVDLDPKYALRIAERTWNPAIWIAPDQSIVIRVPKDRETQMRERLNKRGFWYHTTKRKWFLRRRRRE